MREGGKGRGHLGSESDVGGTTGDRSVRCFLSECGWAPAVDIYQTGTELVVLMELPGVGREDMELHINGDYLTVSGSKVRGGAEGEVFRRMERNTGSFERSVRIPSLVKAAAASASLAEGVLRVVLPVAEEQKPRRLEIEKGS